MIEELHSHILWRPAFVAVWLIHAFHENPHVYNSLQAEVEFVHRSVTLCPSSLVPSVGNSHNLTGRAQIASSALLLWAQELPRAARVRRVRGPRGEAILPGGTLHPGPGQEIVRLLRPSVPQGLARAPGNPCDSPRRPRLPRPKYAPHITRSSPARRTHTDWCWFPFGGRLILSCKIRGSGAQGCRRMLHFRSSWCAVPLQPPNPTRRCLPLCPPGGGDDAKTSHRCPGEQLSTLLLKSLAARLAKDCTWHWTTPQILSYSLLNTPPTPLDGMLVDSFTKTEAAVADTGVDLAQPPVVAVAGADVGAPPSNAVGQNESTAGHTATTDDLNGINNSNSEGGLPTTEVGDTEGPDSVGESRCLCAPQPPLHRGG